jgi:hypothetical protein
MSVISVDFVRGAREARKQVETGDIYDIPGALYLFQLDPADSDFQRGFEQYLRSTLKRERSDD